MNCKYCNKEINNVGGLKHHEKYCMKTSLYKDDIIKLYKDEYYSISQICKLYKVGTKNISEILKDYIRSISETSKIQHKLHPNNYKHTKETKKLLSEKRLEWMKNNPDKAGWTKNEMSYPEKIFYNKLIELGYDKKYYIIRERYFHPYFIDFAFEDYKLAIEIDGSQHLLSERIESDKRKNELLLSNNWSIIRFMAKEIQKNLDSCFKIIEEKLQNLNKIEIIRVGILKYTSIKRYIKKKRDENGFTQKQINIRKVKDRPTLEQIYNDIEKLGCDGISKKYDVSYKTIRKWMKYYTKNDNIFKIKSKIFYKAYLDRRKIEDRPSLEQLEKDINELGYTDTGKKYNISSTSIKRWLKQYLKTDDINNIITKNSKIFKYHNGQLNKRKVEDRPSFEQLKNDIYELDYNGTGKKYNVDRYTIKNWIIYYKEKFVEYKDIEVSIKRDTNGFTEKQLSRRKVERPSLEQLEKDVEELGYIKTGEKYNVFRTTISYWIKQYKK